MTTRNDIFKNVKIGEIFYWGGHVCWKRSTRTAHVDVGESHEDWFYFRQNEPVTVG